MGSWDSEAQLACHRQRQETAGRVHIPQYGAETKRIANLHSDGDK
jgi:hypothetical protein